VDLQNKSEEFLKVSPTGKVRNIRVSARFHSGFERCNLAMSWGSDPAALHLAEAGRKSFQDPRSMR
jgi:hypothetical protein